MTQRIYLSLKQLKARVRRTMTVSKQSLAPVPTWGSLKKYCPVPYDQGALGSCTANAFCHAYKTMCKLAQNADASWDPSRLWVYYWERVLENPGTSPTDLKDSGADVSDAVTYVSQHGMCSECLFPYVPATFDNTPSSAATNDALKHKIKSSTNIPIDANLIAGIESAIITGHPVLTAINVYASFEGDGPATTGMIPLPKPIAYNDPNDAHDAHLGVHEVCIVGYTRDKKLFTVINSWGPCWGSGGFCYISYDYISNPNLGLEFCTISIV